jgi:hypothetical protein
MVNRAGELFGEGTTEGNFMNLGNLEPSPQNVHVLVVPTEVKSHSQRGVLFGTSQKIRTDHLGSRLHCGGVFESRHFDRNGASLKGISCEHQQAGGYDVHRGQDGRVAERRVTSGKKSTVAPGERHGSGYTESSIWFRRSEEAPRELAGSASRRGERSGSGIRPQPGRSLCG